MDFAVSSFPIMYLGSFSILNSATGNGTFFIPNMPLWNIQTLPDYNWSYNKDCRCSQTINNYMSQQWNVCMDVKSRIVCSRIHNPLDICALCVKTRNLEVNFKIGGTWRWVGKWSLIMNINDFLFDLFV